MKNDILSRIIQFYRRLSRREVLMICAGGALLAGFLFLQGVLFPLLEASEGMNRSIERYENMVKEMRTLQDKYETLQSRTADVRKILASRPREFTLFSFLESGAARAGIKDRIQYMKPSTAAARDGSGYEESAVEMKIERVSLKRLVEFLYFVEDPDRLVRIRRISIREEKGASGELTVLIQVVTYQLPAAA